jgi:hypothetical protein
LGSAGDGDNAETVKQRNRETEKQGSRETEKQRNREQGTGNSGQ